MLASFFEAASVVKHYRKYVKATVPTHLKREDSHRRRQQRLLPWDVALLAHARSIASMRCAGLFVNMSRCIVPRAEQFRRTIDQAAEVRIRVRLLREVHFDRLPREMRRDFMSRS